MAHDTKIRGKTFIAGAGFDANGNPKQGKVLVHGRIEVTSFNQGEQLPPSEIGLNTIDYIDIRHEEPSATGSGGTDRQVNYAYATQDFYILEDQDPTPPTDASHNLRFVAFGDSAEDVELL